MAVVGHAYVVVRALTDKVDADIRKGFSGSAASANRAGRDIGNNLADGIGRGLTRISLPKSFSTQFKETLGQSVDLANAFTSLARKGYFVQAGFGAIVGSIGALVGGLGALIGVAGGAASALVAVGAAGITAKVGMSIAGFALKGVGQAASAATKANGGLGKSLRELAFDAEEAALNIDEASIALEKAIEARNRVADLPANSRARREADLNVKKAELALRKAKDAEKNAGKEGGGADPYAGLTPSQKAFAKYLASLKPIMDDLREAAASGFLPILRKQMEKLIAAKLPEILEEKFKKLGKAAGKAVENFTDIFLSGDNLVDFKQVLDDIAENLPSLGSTLGNVFSSFLSILEAADPLTKRFIGFLEKKSNAFRNFLDSKQASGELERFFNQAGNLAARFGTIFGNIFGGFGKIIQANFGPGSGGDTILTWLEETTQGFENMDVIGLQNYFKGAADNFVAMAGAIGGAIETVVKAGSNPAIKEFWEILDSGSFAFQQIIKGSIDSAPALATFLKTMTEIIAVFTDSGQVKAFFDVLNFALGGVAQALKSIQGLINAVGPIFAAVSAFTLLGVALTKTTAIMFGFGLKMIASVAGMIGLNAQALLLRLGLLQLVPAATASGTAMTLALGPVGIAIAAVVAGITAIVVAFNAIHNANMEKATKGIAQGFKEGATAAELWGQATLATVDGPHKEAIDSIDDMKGKMKQLAAAQKDWTYALPSTTAMADSFGAMGRALADTATNDLPKAQAQFKKFTSEVGFSNTEVQTALNEMDEYKTSLIEQADQLGINIRTLQGDIDMQKLANFAIGEGEIAQRRANEAKQAAIDKLAEAARGFVDYQGALNQNKEDVMAWAKAQAAETDDASDSWKDYWDGQSFSMDKYLTDLETQVTAARNWQTNIGRLAGKLDDAVLAEVTNMGEAGAQLVASLVDGVNDEKEIARLNAVGATSANALYDGAKNALTNKPPLTGYIGSQFYINGKATRKDGGYVGYANGGLVKRFMAGGLVTGPGTGRSDSIPALISNGEFVVNARATAENRSLLEAINANKSVSMAPTVHVTINPSAKMDERELAAQVSRQIAFEIRKGGY
jgi:hypothetical protein